MALFFIFNFMLSVYKERSYFSSMLKTVYHIDEKDAFDFKDDEEFDIAAFKKINPSTT